MIDTIVSDEEIICAWMEPKPDPNTHGGSYRSAKNWWYWAGMGWLPRTLILDVLWEVEERLNDEQWDAYDQLTLPMRTGRRHRSNHATAKQKVAALSTVLRKEPA